MAAEIPVDRLGRVLGCFMAVLGSWDRQKINPEPVGGACIEPS
jgi:hypothetical protein